MTTDHSLIVTEKDMVRSPLLNAILRRIGYPVMGCIQRLIRAILIQGLKYIPSLQLERLIHRLVVWRIATLPADEALRFLFRLDATFYSLQGQQATAYGGGVHTKHQHIGYHDFFVNRVQSGERVLDIGCGIGSVAFDIAEKSRANVLGIDMSPENISRARQQYTHPLVSYQVGDALQTLPHESFDVVILSNVLEHLPGRDLFLQRVQALTNPARILIRVPLLERDWRVPLKRELGVEWRLDDTHETEYTLESFTNEVSTAGLKITYQEVRWGEIWAEVRPENGA